MRPLNYLWKFRQISSINRYPNVINGSKSIKFCVKILHRECCEITKKQWFWWNKLYETNCMKQNLLIKNFDITKSCHFQLDHSYASPKAIFHKCQGSYKFECLYSSFVYSMSHDTVYCIESAISLSAEKQRSFGSFVNKWYKGCDNISQKPNIKYRKSIS